jgi:hypothetical protein
MILLHPQQRPVYVTDSLLTADASKHDTAHITDGTIRHVRYCRLRMRN